MSPQIETFVLFPWLEHSLPQHSLRQVHADLVWAHVNIVSNIIQQQSQMLMICQGVPWRVMRTDMYVLRFGIRFIVTLKRDLEDGYRFLHEHSKLGNANLPDA
jgi:hypothetical protein